MKSPKPAIMTVSGATTWRHYRLVALVMLVIPDMMKLSFEIIK
jgi:hypothetical protein